MNFSHTENSDEDRIQSIIGMKLHTYEEMWTLSHLTCSSFCSNVSLSALDQCNKKRFHVLIHTCSTEYE